MHALFTIVADPVTTETLGSTCSRCGDDVKGQKRSGALLAKHLYKACKNSSFVDRLLAWNSSVLLKITEHEPVILVCKARQATGTLPYVDAALAAAETTPGHQLSLVAHRSLQ